MLGNGLVHVLAIKSLAAGRLQDALGSFSGYTGRDLVLVNILSSSLHVLTRSSKRTLSHWPVKYVSATRASAMNLTPDGRDWYIFLPVIHICTANHRCCLCCPKSENRPGQAISSNDISSCFLRALDPIVTPSRNLLAFVLRSGDP